MTQPEADGLTVTFNDDGDCNGPNAGGWNEIAVTIEPSPTLEESYFVIETKRWAFDSPADFMRLLRRVEKVRRALVGKPSKEPK